MKVNNGLSIDLNLTIEENEFSEDCEFKSDGWIRKKLKLSDEQVSILEENFRHYTIPNKEQKTKLASELNLTPRQIVVWFQNRRARTKMKCTEEDCERWKKGCEELGEENKRLKEIIQKLQSSETTPINAGDGFVCPTCRRG